MSDFTIKQDDTSPAIESQLRAEGSPVDLTGSEVRFLLYQEDEGLVIDDDTNGAVSITDASNGIVKYEWQSGDTDTSETYQAEWEVEFLDGTVETFPNGGYIIIEINQDLDNA